MKKKKKIWIDGVFFGGEMMCCAKWMGPFGGAGRGKGGEAFLRNIVLFVC